jgi:hypothetical protein
MPVEALPEAIEDIREKSLLIRRGTEIAEFLNEIKIKAQRIVGDWMLIGNFRLRAFERQINCLGWYLFSTYHRKLRSPFWRSTAGMPWDGR